MNCERKLTNIFSLISIAAAPAFGVLIGVLFNMGLLPGIITGVWIAIAVAALLLAGLLAGAVAFSDGSYARTAVCLSCRVGGLVAAAVGVLLVGIAVLTIGLTVGSLLSAVLVGAGAFFFFFLIVQAVDSIVCFMSASCRC